MNQHAKRVSQIISSKEAGESNRNSPFSPDLLVFTLVITSALLTAQIGSLMLGLTTERTRSILPGPDTTGAGRHKLEDHNMCGITTGGQVGYVRIWQDISFHFWKETQINKTRTTKKLQMCQPSQRVA